jgi:hypothetical protein
MKIRVFQRHCNFSSNSHNKPRPDWFDREKIKDLLEIKWWNWEDEEIKKVVPLLVSNNIDEFIKIAKTK